MTKTGWVLAIGIIVLIAGGGFALYSFNTHPTPTPVAQEEATEATKGTSEEMPASSSATTSAATEVGVSVGMSGPVTVTYTDQGFSPKSVSVAVGSSVKFVNNSTHSMWVASDVHPTHAKYDGTSTSQHCAQGKTTGGTFDECSAVAPGTVYTFAFTKAGSFTYHNHVQASDNGIVIVK